MAAQGYIVPYARPLPYPDFDYQKHADLVAFIKQSGLVMYEECLSVEDFLRQPPPSNYRVGYKRTGSGVSKSSKRNDAFEGDKYILSPHDPRVEASYLKKWRAALNYWSDNEIAFTTQSWPTTLIRESDVK